MWVESQAADGPDSLAHEPIIVFDVVDQLPISVVDGCELVHGATVAGRKDGQDISFCLPVVQEKDSPRGWLRVTACGATGQEVHLCVTLRQEVATHLLLSRGRTRPVPRDARGQVFVLKTG